MLAEHVAQYQRVDFGCSRWAMWLCRPTRREAEAFFHYFAEEMADVEGQAYYRRTRGATVAGAGRLRPSLGRSRTGLRALAVVVTPGGYPGAYPFVGSPDDVAEEMARMSATGLAGCTVAFVDYLKEIPVFVQEVLPRLERLGLRG